VEPVSLLIGTALALLCKGRAKGGTIIQVLKYPFLKETD